MPMVNVTGLTYRSEGEKELLRQMLQVLFESFFKEKFDVELEFSDTKVTFIEDHTESEDAPAIAQIISMYLQELDDQEQQDSLCWKVIEVLEEYGGKAFNEAYPIPVLGMCYRDNPYYQTDSSD